MAINYDLFPPKQEVPDTPPSAIFCVLVFAVVALASAIATLLLWPNGEPTGTAWFFACVTALPIGIASFVVLGFFSTYEGRREDATLWNKACDNHVKQAFLRESLPMVAVAAAYRFSSDAEQDALEKVLNGSLNLETGPTPALEPATVTARWFRKPAVDKHGNANASDAIRHESVLTWLFDELLAQTQQAIRALPRSMRLRVHLAVSGVDDAEAVVRIWNAKWSEHNLFPLRPILTSSDSGLMLVDDWLDRALKTEAHEARLMVSVQLSRVLGGSPTERSAEAGAAVLIVPAGVQRLHNMPAIAVVCRPNSLVDLNHNVAIARAAQWARVSAADVTHLWLAGLDASSAGDAGAPLIQLGADFLATDLDQRVGSAGPTAPWLALAAACQAVSAKPAVHMIASGSGPANTYAVVRGQSPQ